MAIVLKEDYLKTLGLNLAEIQRLSEEDQAKEVKKAWRNKCLLTHPDKGGTQEDFELVNNAYTALMTGHATGEQIQYDINQYFTNQTFPSIDK